MEVQSSLTQNVIRQWKDALNSPSVTQIGILKVLYEYFVIKKLSGSCFSFFKPPTHHGYFPQRSRGTIIPSQVSGD